MVTTSLRSSIAASLSLMPTWGFGGRRQPTQKILRAIASQPRLSLRGGRAPSLASLVANERVFLDPVRYLNFERNYNRPFLDWTQSRIFLQFICSITKNVTDSITKLYVIRLDGPFSFTFFFLFFFFL